MTDNDQIVALNALSLFSGIGGMDIAAELAGFKVTQMVELDPFCQAVLRRHFPNAAVHDDIRSFSTSEHFDLIFGGFPCQDVSVANSCARAGVHGERTGLFTEFVRLIRDIRPSFAVMENVPGLISCGGLYGVLASLSEIGFDAEWSIVSAEQVGAPIKRERVFIVASADGERLEDFAVQVRNNLEMLQRTLENNPLRLGGESIGEWRLPTSGLPVVVDGLQPRVDDLRAVGNAVCPAQVYPIFAAVARCCGLDPKATFPDPWADYSIIRVGG